MIRLEIQNPRALEATLQRFVKRIQDIPERKAGQLADIVNRGILRNYDELAMGGSVEVAGSGLAVSWSQARHPGTMALRARKSLGAIFPLLTLTGRLRDGLVAGGTVSTASGQFTYSPNAGIADLLRAHQLGLSALPPLSGRTGFFKGPLPQRPSVFWSVSMAYETIQMVKRNVRSKT